MSILKRSSKKGIEEMEPKEAFKEIEKHHNDPGFIVLDVRTPPEYQQEHLENAKLLDVKSSGFEEELEKMDKDKKYFVYCKAGVRGCNAVEKMHEHGFKNVTNIKGGIDKWKTKRLPVNE
ncbi:MAG: rhodanese-like domain-containing protein [Methanobacterium sp.]|nr:rhodanese-like domain-containing protein [Methanobacterium sp.]